MNARPIALSVLLAAALLSATAPATAEVSVGIGINVPGVSIGINLPAYPRLVAVPGYPVYYAPQVASNYFFYDGMYWVYQQDNWYASYWYNGPWGMVAPQAVPVFILRVPVRYYRRPPPYFRGWGPDAPPRWGEHWGGDWERQRSGWDRWDHRSAPRPAPLPTYQRQYSGPRYPSAERQPELHSRNYRYQPREDVVREHYQEQRAIAPHRRQDGPQRGGDYGQQSQRAPAQLPRQQAPMQPRQQAPGAQDQDMGPRGKGQEQGKGHDRDEGGGRK